MQVPQLEVHGCHSVREDLVVLESERYLNDTSVIQIFLEKPKNVQ